jgi:hypothetical protein
MTLPLMYLVVLVGFMACEACLLKTPANFIMPFSEPPVIFAVSVYVKSARAGTEPKNRNRQIAAEQNRFTGPPGKMLGVLFYSRARKRVDSAATEEERSGLLRGAATEYHCEVRKVNRWNF